MGGSFFTASLQRVAENTQRYCQRVEGLVNSLAGTCLHIRGIVQCRMEDLATEGLFPEERASFENMIRESIRPTTDEELENFYRNQVQGYLESLRSSLTSSPPRCLPTGDIE